MSTATITQITPQELSNALRANPSAQLLDVRSPAEFETVHASSAINVPLDALDAGKHLSGLGSDQQTIYVICKSGGRSQKACDKFASVGNANVEIINVSGGTDAWDAAGLPVVRGKQTMSIDRQVRIAAGSLVVVGAALSYVHPAFVLLSAFVGAGLVFAGVTNTCAMADVLAKMPWNQVAKCDTGG